MTMPRIAPSGLNPDPMIFLNMGAHSRVSLRTASQQKTATAITLRVSDDMSILFWIINPMCTTMGQISANSRNANQAIGLTGAGSRVRLDFPRKVQTKQQHEHAAA